MPSAFQFTEGLEPLDLSLYKNLLINRVLNTIIKVNPYNLAYKRTTLVV
jgi:hypothetical protein